MALHLKTEKLLFRRMSHIGVGLVLRICDGALHVSTTDSHRCLPPSTENLALS